MVRTSKSRLALNPLIAGTRRCRQHVFRDPDSGQSFLIWKTDDNSVGANTTRIWAQQLVIDAANVSLVGPRRVLLNSSGLWWVDSWVEGGSLIEGPEMMKVGKFYYLFFAAGRYCQPSYAEGVARSTEFWGPYEKAPVALLSTGIVGYSAGEKQIGPGHASYVRHPKSGEYFAVYHASKGDNCNRYAFIERMRFTGAGWPYIDFAPPSSTHAPPPSTGAKPGSPSEPDTRLGSIPRRVVAPCNVLAGGLQAQQSWDVPAAVCGGQPCRAVGLGKPPPEAEQAQGATLPWVWRDSGPMPVCTFSWLY